MIGQHFQSNRAWPADKHAGDVGECVLFYESLDPRYDLFVLQFPDGKREVYHRKELTKRTYKRRPKRLAGRIKRNLEKPDASAKRKALAKQAKRKEKKT